MRLLDLLAVYGVLGVASAAALRRRGPSLALVDLVMTVFLWPMYVPVILGDATKTADTSSPSIVHEHDLLVAALESVRSEVSALLPSREQLSALAEHIQRLDGKVHELDEVLAREDFDPVRAARAVTDAEEDGGAALENARLVQASIERLHNLRARAAHERDELVALCRRLRVQVTVLRFAGSPTEDVGSLVAEILGRVEGVGAAFDPPGTEGSIVLRAT
jgi:hypothetical protein